MLAVHVKSIRPHLTWKSELGKLCGQNCSAFIRKMVLNKTRTWLEGKDLKESPELNSRKLTSRSLFSRWVFRKLLYPDPSVRWWTMFSHMYFKFRLERIAVLFRDDFSSGYLVKSCKKQRQSESNPSGIVYQKFFLRLKKVVKITMKNWFNKSTEIILWEILFATLWCVNEV